MDDKYASYQIAQNEVAVVVSIYNYERPHSSIEFLTPVEAHQKTAILERKLIKPLTSSPGGVFLASCSSAQLDSALSTKTTVNLTQDYFKFVNLSKGYQSKSVNFFQDKTVLGNTYIQYEKICYT